MPKKSLIACAAYILAYTAALSLTAIAQTLPGGTPVGPSQAVADRKAEAEAKKAEAEAHYYEAKTESEQWPGTLQGQAASLFLALAATVTALVALVNWLLARRTARERSSLDWETLRDTQYIDGLKMLSDKDRPGGRAVAAGLIAYLSRNTLGIPDDLVKAQLKRARRFESGVEGHLEVLQAINEALYYLAKNEFPKEEEELKKFIEKIN
jgi:hypothetical protein